MSIQFGDDEESSYCEGDPALEDMDLNQVIKIERLINEIDQDPQERVRDLASVALLDEMYGKALDVR